MDFVTGLPTTKVGYDTKWVIVDRLTKSIKFLSIKQKYNVERSVDIYILEIIARHGVSISIVSDRDARFMPKYWKSFQECLGIKLKLSTTYHPQKDVKRTNSVNIRYKHSKEVGIHIFLWLNSRTITHASIGMPLYEALYGRKCRSPIFWAEVGERKLVGTELVQQTTKVVKKNESD